MSKRLFAILFGGYGRGLSFDGSFGTQVYPVFLMKNFGNLAQNADEVRHAEERGSLADVLENISDSGPEVQRADQRLPKLSGSAVAAVVKAVVQGIRDNLEVLFKAVALVGFLVYCACFYFSVSDWWFSPEWTTDDALQQSYPFLRVFDPELFSGDVITQMMERYLTPIHYGVTAAMTWVTGDAVMAGHVVMLIQLSLLVLGIFLAVSAACGGVVAGMIPGLFAATWMLHTRLIVQRMTGGLPRGWAAPLFAFFLYFALKGNHRGVLATLVFGCLVHPPATIICAGAYGLWLMWDFLRSSSQGRALDSAASRRAWAPLWRFTVLAPFLVVLAWLVVRMPAEIGTMATLERAAHMPEFSTPDGRFPFYPLKPVRWELATFGFQAFASRLHNPGTIIKAAIIPLVVLGCLFLAGVGFRQRREVFPKPVLWFGVATLLVYAAARAFAFQLYVPDRHLQFPLAICFVVGVSIAAWRVGAPYLGASAAHRWWWSYLGLAAVALVVVLGSGSGLQGSGNFNYSAHKKGGVFDWIRAHTPRDALIAGEPSLIDGAMLFGHRTAYITTETAHPFYDGYYATIKPRIEITLRAHYARDLNEFLSLVEPQGIDYFVFDRKRFYPEALASVKYFEPFNSLLREIAGRSWPEYAYRELPREIDMINFPAMPFRDDVSVVVDVQALKTWLAERKP